MFVFVTIKSNRECKKRENETRETRLYMSARSTRQNKFFFCYTILYANAHTICIRRATLQTVAYTTGKNNRSSERHTG